MEPIPMGAFAFGEWDPLSVLFTGEDLDLTQRALGHCPPAGNQMYDTTSLVIPEDYFSASPEEHPAANQTVPGIWESFLDHTVSADCNPPMGSSQESGGFCGYYTQMLESMEERHCTGTFLPDFVGIQDGEGLCGDVRADPADHEASLPSLKKVQPKRKSTNLNSCSREEDDAETGAPQNSKKRKPRASKDKGKRNVQPRKKQKLAKPNRDEGEEGNVIARQEGQSSSTCSSEEDDVPQELNNGESAQNLNEAPAMNSDGKTTRASRGAATDPQSLYARRRRERINERLRILQNLVPNGTKVDISTMLEEAVHYVKFLQLQIKLLSSDELWMYAPIAYNGMDIGLNQILPPQLL